MPSASEFLQVGANKAARAADIQFQAGQLIAQGRAQDRAAKGKLWGTLLGAGVGAATAGFGGLAGMGIGQSFGGILAGGGVGAGLLPGNAFQPQMDWSSIFGGGGGGQSGGWWGQRSPFFAG